MGIWDYMGIPDILRDPGKSGNFPGIGKKFPESKFFQLFLFQEEWFLYL